MFEKAPNGHLVNDLIVFNGLNEGVSKGFIFEPPDLTNAQVAELNDFQDQLSILLASLSEQQRLQIQFYCDSDYRTELLRYREETKSAWAAPKRWALEPTCKNGACSGRRDTFVGRRSARSVALGRDKPEWILRGSHEICVSRSDSDSQQ
jgi:hypothetical protein